MSADTTHAAGPDASSPLALRERLLAALLADGAAVLAQRDDDLATVRLGSGAQVVLITCPPETSPATLRAALGHLVRGGKRGVGALHLVAVGDGKHIARELKRSAPFWQLGRRLGFHQVDGRGAPTRVSGPALPQLRLPEAGLPEADLAVRLAQGSARHQEVALLVRGLRGRFPWATAAIGAVCVALCADRRWS